mmetsp:Transcript_29866/g.64635  ORF Transcript_29866/g.64635 Transcript_29866/m.64635 type:complete len:428 (+) Transcript_29866:66-1349(+)
MASAMATLKVGLPILILGLVIYALCAEMGRAHEREQRLVRLEQRLMLHLQDGEVEEPGTQEEPVEPQRSEDRGRDEEQTALEQATHKAHEEHKIHEDPKNNGAEAAAKQDPELVDLGNHVRGSAKPAQIQDVQQGSEKKALHVAGSDAPVSKLAFVWYLTKYESRNIACAILVAARGIQKTHPEHTASLVVVHTLDEGAIPLRQKMEQLGIRLIKVEQPKTLGRDQWVESFTKLRAAQLYDYDRLIYFDVDTFPLGRLDDLFELGNFPIEVAAPRAYWLPQPFVQSGGPMVIDPRSNFFDKHFRSILEDPGSLSQTGHRRARPAGRFAGEMDWVNQEFRDTVTMLPGFHALLIGEWCASDGIYRHWQKEFDKSSAWVFQHATLVHFIANWKPWVITSPAALNAKCPNAQPELLAAYQKWWSTKAEVC